MHIIVFFNYSIKGMYFPKANSVETNPFCMYAYVLLGIYLQNKFLEVELPDQKVNAYINFHFHSKNRNQCVFPPVCESACLHRLTNRMLLQYFYFYQSGG